MSMHTNTPEVILSVKYLRSFLGLKMCERTPKIFQLLECCFWLSSNTRLLFKYPGNNFKAQMFSLRKTRPWPGNIHLSGLKIPCSTSLTFSRGAVCHTGVILNALKHWRMHHKIRGHSKKPRVHSLEGETSYKTYDWLPGREIFNLLLIIEIKGVILNCESGLCLLSVWSI